MVLVGAAAGAVAVGGMGVVVGRPGGCLLAVPVEPVLEQRGHVHVDAAIIWKIRVANFDRMATLLRTWSSV